MARFPFDFWIATAAIVGVLSAGVLAGVMIGVVLSLGWLIYISTTPQMPVLGREPGTDVFWAVDDHPDAETYRGLLVLRFDAGLFFASASALEDGLRELIQQADPKPHTIVLDFEGVNFIDSQGADELAKILSLATSYGVELRLARLKGSVQALLQRAGVIDQLGESQLYGNVYEAVADKISEAVADKISVEEEG